MSGQSTKHLAASVVMPTYIAARTITDAIEYMLQGTFDDFEFVVCDHASRDDTAAKVAAFDDPRIRLIQKGSTATRWATPSPPAQCKLICYPLHTTTA